MLMPAGSPQNTIFCDRLERECYERLNRWKLSSRQRMVAYWIVRLSFGEGHGFVWITGSLIARLTGLHEPDVSDTIGELQRMSVLHISGPRNRARRFTFLPNAELITPTPAVEENLIEEALAAVRLLNQSADPHVEPLSGQARLPLYDAEEALANDQATASAVLALENPLRPVQAAETAMPSVRTQYQRAREGLERALRLEANWNEADIAATREVPLERVLVGARSILGEEFVARISETLICKPLIQTSGISETLTSPVARDNSQFTVDCTSLPVQSTVKRATQPADENEGAGISESLTRRPSVADPDLMRQLREIIGEQAWSGRDAQGKGNWGALWTTYLRSSPQAANACRQALASYHGARLREVIHKPGPYIRGAFEKIHRSLRAKASEANFRRNPKRQHDHDD